MGKDEGEELVEDVEGAVAARRMLSPSLCLRKEAWTPEEAS